MRDFHYLCIFMHGTSPVLLYCVKIYNNTFKGGGAFEIRKKHQRFRNVAECLVQAKLTPHCKNGNVDIFMEHIFFF